MTPTAIFIADDHPLFRRGLRDLIESKKEFSVVGEASDGVTALADIQRLIPRIALLDIKMPKMNGIEVSNRIFEQSLPVSVIILTMYDDEGMFRNAVQIGVMGYILKEMAVNEIVQGITVVARGDYYFSPALANRSLRSQLANDNSEIEQLFHTLTPAERKVLRMIVDYHSTPEIADALCVSPRTVEHHREHICQKLNLSGRYSLIRFALEHTSLLRD